MGQYKQITLKSQNSNNPAKQTRSQLYRGTSTVNESSKSFALYDQELIKQDILNHFNIKKGEKIYNPNFGSVIWNTLYEPLDRKTREILLADVEQVIASDPRVQARTIDIIEREYGIQLNIELEFVAYSQIEKIVYTFDRENGLSTV